MTPSDERFLCKECEMPLKAIKRMDGNIYWVHPIYRCPKEIQEELNTMTFSDAKKSAHPLVREYIKALENALLSARNEALEEAAKLLEDNTGGEEQTWDEEVVLNHYARKLRRLKSSEERGQ